MVRLGSCDNRTWNADALKIVLPGIEGHRMVPKVVHSGLLRGLVLGITFQNFISLSIFGVRSSFFVQIEAEVKGISHKKLISKSDHFMGMILLSKITIKYPN